MAAINSRMEGELSVLRLEGAHSTLDVALQGAQVINWTTPGTPPVLFLSPNSVFVSGKAIRGGVPLVFPWFGPRRGDPRAPQHGFARVRDWAVRSLSIGPDGECVAALALADDERTRTAWPHGFTAHYTVSAGAALRMVLEIRNTGDEAFTFEAALHSYFAVSDIRRIRLHGLEDTAYLDKTLDQAALDSTDGARRIEGAAPVQFSGETDRVYLATEAACTIEDSGWRRRIVIAKTGSRSTVVWNPWRDKARAMADLGENLWTGMLCVETANAGEDARTLAPGETHTLEATVTVVQD
ncbi:MAG: D-hexose-6-phosphate mutarotase [Betaproteobacteria bacterium]|nr:D-hexose-6-phosphate mutarotase [Betaproteobacteria bacterium]